MWYRVMKGGGSDGGGRERWRVRGEGEMGCEGGGSYGELWKGGEVGSDGGGEW